MLYSSPPELLESLPDDLKPVVDLYWQDWCQSCEAAGLDSNVHVALSTLGRVWGCSEFIARLCLRKPAMFRQMLDDGVDASSQLSDYNLRITAAITEAGESEAELMRALRQQRQQEMLRIAWRDLESLASLQQVLYELSDFAEAMVSTTLNYLYAQMTQTLGTPMNHAGQAQHLLVLAMGKLGGRELNFSSDIDLIFAYADEGQTEGGRKLTNHEFFIRLARQLVKVLNETTQEGFVFRVDTRLRPYGDSGPLVMGFAAMEQYYQSQGRDWERYAMIKARAIAGDDADITHFESMLRPFIYRRYLDYAAFESIRAMKSMIDQQVKSKGMRDNVKLGRGGIREVEFIGQTFQLLRGGRDVQLQTRGILDVLTLLVELKCLTAEEVEQLHQAYAFLRRLENRIQMERDQQAHKLPVDELLRQKLSLAMGCDNWSQLDEQFEYQRNRVHQIFQSIVAHDTDSDSEDEDVAGVLRTYWSGAPSQDEMRQWFEHKGYTDVNLAQELLDSFHGSNRVRNLSQDASQRLLKLMSSMLVEIAAFSNSEVLLQRSLDVLNAIVGRQVYINLLLEFPEARRQMLSLCATSAWFSQQLALTPLLLDELLDARELYHSKNHSALTKELDYLLSSLDDNDLEQIMDRLRQFKNAQLMKAAVLDVNDILGVTDVGDTLSDIAEVLLLKTLDLAWHDMSLKYGQPCCRIDDEKFYPSIGIIAYGKLGGLELGYGSDLDIVFLHDSRGEKQVTEGVKSIDNSTFFSRVAQRVLHILGTRTHSGMLYETDIRLRPEGRSGMMVSSINAFEQYQHDKAWTWEHQALLRARIVAGNDHVRQEFGRIRLSVLAVARDQGELLRDVVEMREKMRGHLASRDNSHFDIKQDVGGIVDIEFIVQAGVLLNAEAYPDLLQTTSTLVYLERLAACGWLGKDESIALSAAYKEFRQQTNRQALLIEQIEMDETKSLKAHRKQVNAVWTRIMPANTE